MAFVLKAFCMVLVAVICIQLYNAQTIPLRCQCVHLSSRPYLWKNIQAFSIISPHSRCQTTEIIVTMKAINAETGKHEKRCISPKLNQAKILEQCWKRNYNSSLEILQVSECGQRK